MSKIKNAIEISNKLAEYIVTATENSLNEKEEAYMHETLFEELFSIFKIYDEKTLETLNRNL